MCSSKYILLRSVRNTRITLIELYMILNRYEAAKTTPNVAVLIN